MELSEAITHFRKNLLDFENENCSNLKKLDKRIEEIIDLVSKYDKYSSGSWVPGKAQQYHRNDGICFTLTYDDIEDQVKKELSISSLSIIDSDISSSQKKAINLKEFFEDYFIIIESDCRYEPIKKIIEDIRKIRWNFPSKKFVEALMPKNMILSYDDMDSVGNGRFQPPPHIAFQCQCYSIRHKITTISEFIRFSKHMLSQIDIINTHNSNSIENTPDVELLLSRFHEVAKHLTTRHQNRNSIFISDEYDVQDLLYSLLWIFFDDVRKEENTPSFAGGSARMDILIKDNNSVIEVKKTRKGLLDKELGKQLIEDIAYYKNHGNCEKLYCFIYDPDFIILNRKGLSSDIEQTADLSVKVIINP